MLLTTTSVSDVSTLDACLSVARPLVRSREVRPLLSNVDNAPIQADDVQAQETSYLAAHVSFGSDANATKTLQISARR